MEDDWIYIQNKKTTRSVDLRLKNRIWDEVEDRCRKEGLSLKEWIENCVRHELVAKGVFEKVRRIFDRHLGFGKKKDP